MEFPLNRVHVLDHRNSAGRFTASMAPIFSQLQFLDEPPVGVGLQLCQNRVHSSQSQVTSTIPPQNFSINSFLCAMFFGFF